MKRDLNLTALVSTTNVPSLTKPGFSVDKFRGLLNFLETKKMERGFPSISVFPNLLESVVTLINERKRMRDEEAQFQAKLSLARDMVDKQLAFEIQKLNQQTELQIASIRGDVQTRLEQINRYYDAEIMRIEKEYSLKREEMRAKYQMLEKLRKDKNQQFLMILYRFERERGEIRNVIQESAMITRFLQKKIMNNSASPDEWQYYLFLMQLRLESIGNLGEAICKLAYEVKLI